jgi:hypothetical protein
LADNTAFVPGKTSRADGGKVSCFHDGSAIHRTHPHRQPDVDKTSYNTMLQRAGGRLRAQTGSYGGGAHCQRARCNNCGVKGNNTYQIVYTGNSDVAMDGAGVKRS